MNLAEFGRSLLRRRYLFLGVVGGVVLVVMGLTLLLSPVYESEASVRIQSSRSGGMGAGMLSGLEDALPTGLALPGLSDADVQTEIGVLGSREILERVADSLALHVELVRPRRAFRTTVLHVPDGAGEAAPRGVYSLRSVAGGGYAISARGTRGPVALPDEVRIGEPFNVGPMTFLLDPELAEDPPRLIRFRVAPFRRFMQKLRKEVRIQRQDAGSRLVQIHWRHPDPYLAQGFVNGVVDRFLEYSETTNKSDTRREVGILAEQVDHYAVEVAEAERRLQSFQQAERIVHPEEQATQQVRRVAQLQVAHDAMSVERSALMELLREVSSRAPRPGAETPYRQLATFPSFITNAAVQELLEALTVLETERAELMVLRTEASLDVRAVQGRIREIEEELFRLATHYLEGLETQIASTADALARFGAELEEIPAIEIEYARRVRDRRLASEIHLMLQARLAEAQLQEEIDDARVRLVDRGVVEDRPAFPRPEISLALAGVLGIFMGLFTVVAAESGNRRVRSRGDAERAAGAAVIAEVGPMRRRRGRGSGEINLPVRDDPFHPASDAFRSLALELRRRDPAPGTVLITGPRAGEGTSTVSANLALALSRLGARVALVDMELRGAGGLRRGLGADAGAGWPEIARGERSIEDVARRLEGDEESGRLDLFPSSGHRGHPLDQLSSEGTRTFLLGLSERYEVVLLDSASLEAGEDAVLLAGWVDGAVLVVGTKDTSAESVEEAAVRIRRGGGALLGLVLNAGG